MYFMEIQLTDYEKLQRLGLSDLLSLAKFTPKSYSDTALLRELGKVSSQGVVEIDILGTSFLRGKKIFKVQAQMPKFDQILEIIIFNAKPFHQAIFTSEKSLLVAGKIEYKFGRYTLTQPKIVQTSGQIIPNFKTTSLKNATIIELSQRLLTKQNLIEEGLPENIAVKIEKIFAPTQGFLQQYQKSDSFPPDYLYALKWVEIYSYLKRISKKRRYFEAKYSCKGDYKSFIASLPFCLTPSQAKAIEDIAQDLVKNTASKRLIMGDVGCGKTIVILSAVTIAYPYKTLLMVPTTILARQLYEEAQKFLPSYINILLITADTKDDLSKTPSLFNDEAHFIIGTQALLYREFDTQKFALVMSDEQHRFGAKQRHQLEKITEEKPFKNIKKPHVLQFSATPIPRTMAMLNSSLIDFSFIKDLPFKKDIITRIITKTDFPELIRHIQIEVSQNRQVVIVYPLVEESKNFDYISLKEGTDFWKKHFKNVFVTSGKDKEKEQVLQDFREKGDILLATTLVEVGISLPRLSSIVIVAPERLGLATLHQLRGRVSRNGLKGYCFLYANSVKSERLKEFSQNLSGFDIAEIDLKYRSGGDLIGGERQSGAEFEFFDMRTDVKILCDVRKNLQI